MGDDWGVKHILISFFPFSKFLCNFYNFLPILKNGAHPLVLTFKNVIMGLLLTGGFLCCVIKQNVQRKRLGLLSVCSLSDACCIKVKRRLLETFLSFSTFFFSWFFVASFSLYSGYKVGAACYWRHSALVVVCFGNKCF